MVREHHFCKISSPTGRSQDCYPSWIDPVSDWTLVLVSPIEHLLGVTLLLEFPTGRGYGRYPSRGPGHKMCV